MEDRNEGRLRRRLVDVSRQLVASGLNRGTSGNAGVRLGDGLLVTPSGVPADELSPEDMVALDFSGQVHGSGRPSSEWRLHRDVLAARPDVHAVIHTHAPFATSLACLGQDVPPFHYMIAVAGGRTIRCAAYALFGTQALSDQAVLALQARKACLLANHGMVALGCDLDEALALSIEVESLCEMYWRACQLGAPQILCDAQMDEVIARFKHYGLQAGDEKAQA
jgi:L-fuculose-phosphate aldolase